MSTLSALSLTMAGIGVFSVPSQAEDSKSITISGFAANVAKPTKQMRSQVKDFLEQNPEYAFVSCVGFADRSGLGPGNLKLGKKRAARVCGLALTSNDYIQLGTISGRQDSLRAGSQIRRVQVTLSNSANGQFVTSFDPGFGSVNPKALRVRTGEGVVLPLPTREGYSFTGWYSAPSAGVWIGSAGMSYTPSKSVKLFAQWAQITVSNREVSQSSLPATIKLDVRLKKEADGDICSDLSTGWQATSGQVFFGLPMFLLEDFEGDSEQVIEQVTSLTSLSDGTDSDEGYCVGEFDVVLFDVSQYAEGESEATGQLSTATLTSGMKVAVEVFISDRIRTPNPVLKKSPTLPWIEYSDFSVLTERGSEDGVFVLPVNPSNIHLVAEVTLVDGENVLSLTGDLDYSPVFPNSLPL